MLASIASKGVPVFMAALEVVGWGPLKKELAIHLQGR